MDTHTHACIHVHMHMRTPKHTVRQSMPKQASLVLMWKTLRWLMHEER